jgi:hypothetical protein
LPSKASLAFFERFLLGCFADAFRAGFLLRLGRLPLPLASSLFLPSGSSLAWPLLLRFSGFAFGSGFQLSGFGFRFYRLIRDPKDAASSLLRRF